MPVRLMSILRAVLVVVSSVWSAERLAAQSSPSTGDPAAVADSLRHAATVTDTAALGVLVTRASRWTDARIFTAAQDVAVSNAATTEARVAALIVLAGYIAPQQVIAISHFLAPTSELRSCVGFGMNSHHERDQGQSVPANARATLQSLGTALRDDQSLSTSVRFGGGCLVRLASVTP